MEMQILYGIQELRTSFLDSFFVFITSLGNSGFIWIVLGILLVIFKKTRKTGLVILFAMSLGFLLGNMALKNLIQRSRPCWEDPSISLLISNPHDFSFPSGHTLHSFAAAFSIFLSHKKAGIISLLLASLIAFSRLYLFVHYPTDILGGLVLGLLLALISNYCVKKWTTKLW